MIRVTPAVLANATKGFKIGFEEDKSRLTPVFYFQEHQTKDE